VFTEVQLTRSPNTIIVGENGAGKSTILDALCYVLFNKPFRKINKPQMMNTINQRDMIVEIEFSIGRRNYKVVRGYKPNIFEIYQDDVLLNQPGSSRDYQAQLEETILKLNYRSFTQIVVLGSSTFVPFMQLAASHRREVIEDLLDIGIFTNMGKLLKDRIAENKDNIKESEYQCELMLSKIETQEQYIEKLKKQSEETVSKFMSLIEEAWAEIDSLESVNAITGVQVREALQEVAEAEKLNKKSTKIFDLINKLKEKHNKAHKRIDFFENHDNCPTCEQLIDAEIKATKIQETNDIIDSVKGGVSDLEKEYEELQKQIVEMQKKQEEISQLQSSINNNSTEIATIKKSIDKNQAEIDKLRQESADDKDELDKLELIKQELFIFEKRREELVEEREVYKVAADMLKDGGIKTRIIRQYVPVMNKLINKYLAALDFFVSFELDEEFNEVIKSRHRDVFTYASFSEGEKMRIDLALLFTWRAIAKLKNSTNTNLLILDEVFDASLDTSGCDEFLKLLQELGGETNVFVISHKGDILQDKFRSQIRFEKVKNFSRIAA
jgi:DNA repair exonuclease SbcCD ATPase subunit